MNSEVIDAAKIEAEQIKSVINICCFQFLNHGIHCYTVVLHLNIEFQSAMKSESN